MVIYLDDTCKVPYTVSRLYALKPEGLQTGLTEGIVSYITRLAAAHHICMGDLIKDIISSQLEREYLQNDISRGGSRFYQRAKSLNGVGLHTKSIVDILSTLTTVDKLENLTLLPWEEVICDKYLFKPSKAWCTQCYYEWNAEGKPLYEPLLWSLKDVSYCPIHNSLLSSQCPNADCKKEIAPLGRCSVVGFCPHCFTWLGKLTINYRLPNRDELRSSITMYRLISQTERTKEFNIHRSNIHKSFQFLLRFTSGNAARLANFLQMHPTTIWQYCHGKFIPPLSTMLRICKQLDIDLIDFLSGNISTISLDFSIPVSSNKRLSTYNAPNYDIIASKLHHYTKCDPPVSLSTVSKQMNYSIKSIKKNFPIVAEEIKNRFKNDKLKNKRITARTTHNDIVRTISVLRSNGIYPNRRNIERCLNRKGLLLRTEYKEIWKKHVHNTSDTKVVNVN
ncbi:TniQ family protein [Paenibacillus marchantiae]|uniref:TniQ family protein n=1 Tax=Paenibacillus marchantiae TaxID=3026433 RepID=UPI00237B3B24|nr:TniQ family protein [Paenibacillus marchantiae]WDQ32165.1 TniQ family protein [Paenibacillus marchantiae]